MQMIRSRRPYVPPNQDIVPAGGGGGGGGAPPGNPPSSVSIPIRSIPQNANVSIAPSSPNASYY
jgi:hypothetical protein